MTMYLVLTWIDPLVQKYSVTS